MEVNVNTDNTIQRHQGLDERVRAQVEEAIARFGDHVHRVDVHLSNENKEKHEDGSNYCMMEARVSGYAPVVVHAHAENLAQSIASAITCWTICSVVCRAISKPQSGQCGMPIDEYSRRR